MKCDAQVSIHDIYTVHAHLQIQSIHSEILISRSKYYSVIKPPYITETRFVLPKKAARRFRRDR
jgi:hypothetical protein